MERLKVPNSCKARRSARVPRTSMWGVHILHPDQQNVQQDELEALEALCFLSAGISQVPADAAKPYSASRPGKAGARRQQPKQQSKQPKPKPQRLPQPKKAARRSPGSETSSGATQCGLTPAQAAELQFTLSLEEIHPAALPGPDVAQLLQQQQQHYAESSDTRLAVGTLTPMPSEDWAAQSRQRSPGTQASLPSPEPLQQEQKQQEQQPEAEPDAVVPSLSPVTAQLSPPMPSSVAGLRPWELSAAAVPQQQELPAVNRPPVKGCFWHVYIAKMIQADQQRQEQQKKKQDKQQDEQQQKKMQGKQQLNSSKRPQQQQDSPAAVHKAAAPAKKQRTEQPLQRRSQPSNLGAGVAPPPAVQLAPSMPQHAAAVQHILAHTLLQQRQQPTGVSALLRQQMPRAAAAVQPSALDLLPGLSPAVAAAAAGCPQLLQALGAAAASAAPSVAAPGGGLFGPAGLLAAGGGAMSGGLQGPHAAAALRLFGALPGSFPAPAGLAPAGLAQLQGLLGSVGQLSAAMAPPAAPGVGSLAALMGVAGMQHHMHPSRVAA